MSYRMPSAYHPRFSIDMKKPAARAETAQHTQRSLTAYYRLHSKIYDATRWSFLFGRKALIGRIPSEAEPDAILEVGCGTGTNLERLARVFPQAEIHGLDLSPAMLRQAHRRLSPYGDRVQLHQRAYHEPIRVDRPFDIVLFSYSLSMFNPGWEHALECARDDLTRAGMVCVVDFHDTRRELFSRWMELHHVRLDGHLLRGLRERFSPRLEEVSNAWLGLWRYFQFIGTKKDESQVATLPGV